MLFSQHVFGTTHYLTTRPEISTELLQELALLPYFLFNNTWFLISCFENICTRIHTQYPYIIHTHTHTHQQLTRCPVHTYFYRYTWELQTHGTTSKKNYQSQDFYREKLSPVFDSCLQHFCRIFYQYSIISVCHDFVIFVVDTKALSKRMYHCKLLFGLCREYDDIHMHS